MSKITKAIIPAAGLGTRFLPQTKAMPKEMLPIVDKPVIQIIVEDLVAAGVKDIIIVTGPQKRAIEDHFDRAYELEKELRERGKVDYADEIARIGELANFVYLRQKGEVKGNAVPLLNAAHLIKDEPFFYFYADDFFLGQKTQAQQLAEAYEKVGKPIMTLREVGDEDIPKLGIAEIEGNRKDKVVKVKNIVEKPTLEEAPTNYASVGGYLLTPDMIKEVSKEVVSERNEIELAEAVNRYAQNNDVYGCFVEGTRHDAGHQLGYLKANLDAAMQRDDLKDDLSNYMKGLLS